jgi:hypothetical protein
VAKERSKAVVNAVALVKSKQVEGHGHGVTVAKDVTGYRENVLGCERFVFASIGRKTM